MTDSQENVYLTNAYEVYCLLFLGARSSVYFVSLYSYGESVRVFNNFAINEI